MSLRERLSEALKTAMRAKDQPTVDAVRMIIAKLKEKDIEARGRGVTDGIGEDEMLSMMQGMIKQRRESIELYDKGGRPELADKERAEIAIIEGFLPKQMSEEEAMAAIRGVVAETGAASVKDMGKVMAELKARYAGQMDFSKASGLVKQALSGG
ncbi:GatB/YqeY domain-containing protein [Azospirillum sp.]|uniref:GatB/YqeY domain-containing protein n=1 Tax=Azospirillum sp. TaxID=34012 RepID=UPI002D511470|nr:GatB/YqeY domain-containing protein [Azospirillum sp.]HYD67630.1 GatB/YqeY domain-containing protein [Azospirillum sp.]